MIQVDEKANAIHREPAIPKVLKRWEDEIQASYEEEKNAKNLPSYP